MSQKACIYFYKNELGEKIPILSAESTNLRSLVLLSEENKKAIITDFPECNNNLFILVDGTEFKLL